uniref:Uncharacterized protein n=1 Tax=Tanacetum cinerariifolium TaxID=118510 RepID=A0A699SFH0_TANCI|nr:hypothetical protein [Tanacetum cinerariifolium]
MRTRFPSPKVEVLKNGRDLSTDLARKRLRAASFPLKLCIFFSVRGDWRSAKSLVFLGLALIPFDVTIYPRNFPSSTTKEHFFGFNFILIFFKLSKVSAMSANNIFSCLLLITMSSTYASKILPI